MVKNKILCVIYNHNKNENSKLWLDRLSEQYETYVFDSGSDEPMENDNVLKFGNIYWGGMFDESVKLLNSEGKEYEWLFVVCDDILCDEENFTKLVSSLNRISTTNNVGEYQPSSTSESHNIWDNNKNRGSGQMRITYNIEGWMFLVRKDVVDRICTYGIDYATEMKYGWGIDVLLSNASLRMGYLNVVDDSVVVEHPKGDSNYDGNSANVEMAKAFYKIGETYNGLILEDVKIMNNTIHGIKPVHTKMICFVYNYKHDENATRLYNILSKRYETYLIDTFHKEDGSKFEGDVPEDHLVLIDNVYWGGSYLKAYEILKEKGGDYLMSVDSDVEIDNANAMSMLQSLKIFDTDNNIGVYTGTLKMGSKAGGSVLPTIQNAHLYNQGSNQLRNVFRMEGWLNVIKRCVLDDILPKFNNIDNKYGWGFGHVFCRRAINRNLRVVADDRYEVYHPAGLSYNNELAQEEENRVRLRYGELGCLLDEEFGYDISKIVL